MSRVAIAGGSFNPPHLAHQMVCLWCLSSGQVDEVWLMPCYEHAFGKKLADFRHRCAMCELASRVFAPGRVSVCRAEAELPGPSRTLLTLRHLQQQHPGHEFSLVIGADILPETDDWYRFDEIQRMVTVMVVGRQGYASPDGVPTLPAISSTEVRARLRRGDDASDLVPRSVLDYIEAHDLYRGH